jgi:hypothetical protein
MLTLLFSLVGLIVGFIVSMFALEELEKGTKYFFFMKWVLLSLIFLTINYFFLDVGNYLLNVIFSLVFIVIFIVEMKNRSLAAELAYYFTFIAAYFVLALMAIIPEHLMILNVLVFLYGVPVGTLLHMKFIGIGLGEK